MSPKYLIVAGLMFAASAPLSAQSVKVGIEAWQRGDYSAAVAIWRRLAEKGDPDAQFNLGQAYRLGRGVPTNLAAAKTWFERSANQGHVDAETTLGLLLFQNGDQAAGMKWLKMAAEKGEPRALLVYGTALVNGDGVTQDPVLGYAYVSRAAAQGFAPAKETLAQLDALLPLADRKKGLAIAQAKARAAPPPSSPPAHAKLAPKPVPVAAGKSPAPPAPKPVQKAASPKPAAAPAAAAPGAGGGWRIQLGAFSQRGSAEALYRKLSGKLSGHQPFYVPAGGITRLQVGPYSSRAAAQAACSVLAVPCFPVAAK